MNQYGKQSKKSALVVSCGRAKVWRTNPSCGLVRARDAYVGPLFRACRRYAEVFYPDDWFILSAKYGLLCPEALIENYDVTFCNRGSSGSITEDQLRKQVEVNLLRYDVVVSLASREYNRRLAKLLMDKQTLELPLAKLSLFDRMKWLKTAVLNKKV